MKKIATAVLGISLVLTAFPFGETVYAKENHVQVKLTREYDNLSSILFKLSGKYTIKDTNVSLEENHHYTLKYENSKIVLYDDSKKLAEKPLEMIFIPEKIDDSHVFHIGNNKYMGEMKIAIEESTIQPINTLPLDEYLRGVVPKEMPSSWHEEALKAQTVTARTYAKRYEGEVINDTVSYQVYGGLIDDNYKEKIKKVIDETSGQYLTYKGELAGTYYSSSNGGYTESSENIWGNKVDYLTVKKDTYDPKLEWVYSFKHTQIDLTGMDLKQPENWWNEIKEGEIKRSFVPYLKNQILKSEGENVKEVKILSIPLVELSQPKNNNPRSITGKIKLNYIVQNKDDSFVKDENGDIKIHTFEKSYPADQLRAMFGNTEFKSALISSLMFDENSGTYTFKGFGYGHGVGMSQHGANKRAEDGHTYEEILSFYYPGTTLTKEINNQKPEPENPIVEKETYEVQKGDTLYSISKKYNVSVSDLKKENNLTSDIIYAGQVLTIPIKDKDPIDKPIETPVEKPDNKKPTRDKEPKKGEVNIYVKGKQIAMDVKPMIKKGTTFVPVRAVMENLGIEVKWNQKTSTVTVLDGEKEIKMTIGNKTAYINGKAVELPMAPILEKNRTLIPIRFVAESTGYTVDWEQKTTSIDIY